MPKQTKPKDDGLKYLAIKVPTPLYNALETAYSQEKAKRQGASIYDRADFLREKLAEAVGFHEQETT